ncbi:MAG: hypothetical protein AB7H77_12345 [Bdellovibrionales bacterium]
MAVVADRSQQPVVQNLRVCLARQFVSLSSFGEVDVALRDDARS